MKIAERLKSVVRILLILALTVAASFLLGKFLPTGSIQIAPKEEDIKIDPMVGWLIYAVPELGFQLRLPPGYRLAGGRDSASVYAESATGTDAKKPVITIEIRKTAEGRGYPPGAKTVQDGDRTFVIIPAQRLEFDRFDLIVSTFQTITE
jgi:hypothetical protein